ncbi:hypothetical protein D3C87_1732540 [compost metagenome]
MAKQVGVKMPQARVFFDHLRESSPESIQSDLSSLALSLFMLYENESGLLEPHIWNVGTPSPQVFKDLLFKFGRDCDVSA